MTRRIDKSCIVVDSIENHAHDRCVDLFQRPDGTWGFEEFRRDAEDQGGWTPVAYYSDIVYPSMDSARRAAVRTVAWMD